MRAADRARTPALQLEHIARRFGPTRALSDASIAVARGTVHALLGENGAGKTTLMRIAFGMLRPDAGTMRVDGAPVRLASPADAIRLGVGMVHQHFTLVPAMTVAENVVLGGRGRYDARAAAERVREIGRETGLVLDPAARADTLRVGAQQRLEIVKALHRGASILILDEPTAVLAPAEAEELTAVLRRYADAGNAVVLITHKLREALAIADDVTVLRLGRTVHAAAARGTSTDDLARAMLGGELPAERTPDIAVEPELAEPDVAPGSPPRSQDTESAPSTPHRSIPGDSVPPHPTVVARALVLADERGVVTVSEAAFELRPREIVGIAAVEGAGQRELLRALAGRATPIRGTLELPPTVAYIPDDRHHDALILDFPLHENVALRGANRFRGRVPWRRLRESTARLVREFDVRAPSIDVAAHALSGGNQQKLVLARELDGAPRLVVASQPTRGLDIAATAAVHARLRAARDAGATVVVHSSDLDEVLALADRVLVVYAGTVREVARERDAVGRAMLGLDREPIAERPQPT